MSTQLNGTLEILGLDVEDSLVKSMNMEEDAAASPDETLAEWEEGFWDNPDVYIIHLIRWTDWDNGECVTLAEKRRPA